MLQSKHILIIFIPALLIISGIFTLRFFEYRNVFQNEDAAPQNGETDLIPILPDDPILGEIKAGRTIIAFEDFGCEGCKAQIALLEELMEKHKGKIKIIWKGLPVTTFPYNSKMAHEYAFCANRQEKFQVFKEFAFANSENLSEAALKIIAGKMDMNRKEFDACLASNQPEAYINQIEQLAIALNIQSVPTMFIDHKQIAPPSVIEGWETLLGL